MRSSTEGSVLLLALHELPVDAAHARESLRQPFKHADAYAAAQARSAQIADQMRHRQQQPPETRDADPGENPSAIQRASFPAPAVEALTARQADSPRTGARGPDPSRSHLHDRKPGAVRRPDDLQR